jgi:hypothetical protein
MKNKNHTNGFVPKIQKTSDYSLFKNLDINRDLQKLRRLRESILKDGYWSWSPIEVTSDFLVLDGKHRLHLCMEFKIPVYYIVLPQFTERGKIKVYVKQKNTTQKNWTLGDHVHCEAVDGLKCHREILDIEKRHKLGISNSITISLLKAGATSIVKGGKELPLNPNRHKCAEFIHACKGFPYNKTQPFVRAVHALFCVGQEHHIEKLLKHHKQIDHLATKEAYIRCFANIINKHCRGDVGKIAF